MNRHSNRKPHSRSVYHRSGTYVYYDNTYRKQRNDVHFVLKTKYSTIRQYILKRLNDENDRDIVWVDRNERKFKFANDPAWTAACRDYERECLVEEPHCSPAEAYLRMSFGPSYTGEHQLPVPTAPFTDFYYTYFLEKGTTIEWIITMLLEGIDTEYIKWVDEKAKIFKIYKREELHQIFNRAREYHDMPVTEYNEFVDELKDFCYMNIMKEVGNFTYQFDQKWYSDEMNNQHITEQFFLTD